MAKRPTIGFLINDVVNSYQYTLWSGVDQGCREAGFDLIVFTGGELGSPEPVKAVRTRVFELANSQNIQGMVIAASAVGHYLSPEQVAAYCRSFAPLPVVTLGFEIPKVPTVLVNNSAGMEEAVEHLITQHGRKKIAYIGGHLADSCAVERRGAYHRVLERHGLVPDPTLDEVGNYDFGVARDVTRRWLERKLSFDAIVAANDTMALGAMEALQQHGIRIPDEVTVSGFDNVLESQFCTPPLSTVRQPIAEQGLVGVQLLQKMLQGETPSDTHPILSTSYVARKSCGCVSHELDQAFLTPTNLTKPSAVELSGLVDQLSQNAPSSLSGEVGPLLAALEKDLGEGACAESLLQIERGIERTRKAGGQLKDWQGLINAERQLVLSTFSDNDPRTLVAESIWHQQRVALGEAEVQSVAYENVALENRIREMNLLGSNFVNSFNVSLLIQQMIDGLPGQGIPTSYLLLNDPDEGHKSTSRLMMAMEGGRTLPLTPDGVPLDAGAIFPSHFVQAAERRTLVIEPLFFNDSLLGFLAYQLSPARGMVFDALRTLISAAIQGARLVTQVRQRTEELEVAYSSLHSMSQQIRDILQNIEQGLFVIDLAGAIEPDCSKSVHGLLGLPDVTKVSLREALRLTHDQDEDFRSWLKLVESKHEGLRWEKLTKVAPLRDLEVARPGEDPRYLRLAYQKMSDADRKLRKIMVMVIDETETRRVARIVQAERERHENEVKTIVGLVNNLPEVIQDYLDDTQRRILSTTDGIASMVEPARTAREGYPGAPHFEPDPDLMARIFRDLHTIKGNSATYGFELLTHLAHQAEDLLEALKQPIEVRSTATLESLQAKLCAMEEAFQEVIKVRSRLMDSSGEESTVRIPNRKLSTLQNSVIELKQAVSGPSVEMLVEAMNHLRDVPLEQLVEKYNKMLQRVGDRLGKKIEFTTFPKGLELEPNFFAPYDEALLHILRNSVDHGIESPEIRKPAGKPEAGSIKLEIQRNLGNVLIRISDDGHGIKADRVVEKAIEQGLITSDEAIDMSTEDKLGLIFGSGISTAAEISDISGRGVGMSAVRESILALGGRISVSSEPGKGTCIELLVPKN